MAWMGKTDQIKEQAGKLGWKVNGEDIRKLFDMYTILLDKHPCDDFDRLNTVKRFDAALLAMLREVAKNQVWLDSGAPDLPSPPQRMVEDSIRRYALDEQYRHELQTDDAAFLMTLNETREQHRKWAKG